MRTTIERLVAENHLKEEHLLVLEGARIDIKSALEKASLKKARKRSLPAGSLSSGVKFTALFISTVQRIVLLPSVESTDINKDLLRRFYHCPPDLLSSDHFERD